MLEIETIIGTNRKTEPESILKFRTEFRPEPESERNFLVHNGLGAESKFSSTDISVQLEFTFYSMSLNQ